MTEEKEREQIITQLPATFDEEVFNKIAKDYSKLLHAVGRL